MDESVSKQIGSLISRARTAQLSIEHLEQDEVDKLVLDLGWELVNLDFSRKLSAVLVEESGMGNIDDKVAKIQNKVRGVLWDMKDVQTVGVVERDEKMGITKIAKPVGVIGAVIPVTNGEATPMVKGLSAIKTRNAIVFAPHPKGKRTTALIIERFRAVLKANGYNPDLVIGLEPVSVERTIELMRQCDLILATGGAAMVKEAYSSGTPSEGVGAGNAVSIIDDSCNIEETADKIKRSKTFDYATSCSTENSLVISSGIYDDMLKALQDQGGYVVSSEEKKRLQSALWKDGVLNRDLVARPAERIAEASDISLPKGTSFFLVEESGVGPEYPFSGEKLTVISAVYAWDTFEEAVALVNAITSFSGPGHSCGIHTADESQIMYLASRVNVSRLMVNQPQCLANSGAWTNGMPMSLTLGCGTWGGNASSSNIYWKHMLNYTWISVPIPSRKPTDEQLFGAERMKS